MTLKKFLLLFALCGSITEGMVGQEPSISNIDPKLTLEGAIVDAHDGRVAKFGDRYYWYGTSYGTTNGFTTKNHYVCYSSADMKNWKKEGAIFKKQPEGVYYRPHVIYNEKSRNYVLWYNWYPKLWDGKFGVATSNNPQGPFKIQNDDVKMVRSEVGLGDFGLFVDDDKNAYISYNTIQNHQVSVERLTDNYLASTQENGGVIAEHMEAGSQFKRNGKYYLLTDYTCCFCNYGSGARVYISDHPMKGYAYTGNINRYPGEKTLTLTDGKKTGTQYVTLKKQEDKFYSLQTQLRKREAVSTVELYMFTGNRPENCGNVENPRVHPEITMPDFEISAWQYDKWVKLKVTGKAIKKKALSEIVTLDIEPIATDKIKLTVSSDFPLSETYVNEIVLFESKAVEITGNEWYIVGAGIPEKPIIPAQQTYVMPLGSKNGQNYIWMGDLWGSASDNVKGHDYQYWSSPLQFNEDGTILPLEWEDNWVLP